MKHEHNFAIREDRNNKMKKQTKEKRKKVIAILIIIVLISLAIGISYSAWRYVFTGKENKITTGDVSIKFLESNTNVINLSNALPEDDTTGKKEKSFDFVVTTKATYKTALKYDLSIKKLSTDTGYTSLNNNQIKVYLTDSSNNVLVGPTLISNLNNNLLYSKTNNHSSTNTEVNDKYKLRVWIDKNVDASSWTKDTKNQYKFKIGLKSEEVEVSSGPNEPVLDDGMIPVYYDETSETWKKADSSNKDNNWYNYDSKKWANSVTVSSTNRGTYKSASVGTEIPMDDILTMQVWIPRYKYKVWNYNADGKKTSSPQEIEITWEEGTSKTGEITCTDSIQGSSGDGASETCKIDNKVCTDATCNGKTYTHPAFTFGNEEIKGFWIGKFEVSATTSLDLTTISYKEKHENENITANNIAYYSDDDEDIIVKKLAPWDAICTILYDRTNLYSCSDTYFALTKPNIYRWTYGTVKLYEDSIMNMKNSNNSYGLSSSTDTHMIKNSEWGAVAYLSHSKYGTCTDGTCNEVRINNNSNYTGCGDKAGSSSSTTCNAYNTTNGILASTTQNIYGVYDMSGGAYEYTMSNIVNTDGTTMVPGYSDYTTSTYPDAKYYDKYSYSASDTTRKRSKLGDGIKEVYNGSEGWYSDYSYLAGSSNPWFRRGGHYGNVAGAGVFYSNGDFGNSDSTYSSRPVITP